MTNNLSSGKPKIRLKKLDFWTLFKRFKSKVIKHFLVTVFRTILNIVLFEAFFELFRISSKEEVVNFTKLLMPEKIRGWGIFRDLKLNERDFIISGLVLVLIYAFIYYWDYLWEEELKIKGGHYVKNVLFDKFRQLPFAERQAKKDEINKLVESDSSEVGYYWEHLPNHVFHSALTIIITLYFYWDKFWDMTSQEIIFSLFWLALINVVVYFFTKTILLNEKKYKQRLSEEWTVINKERSNINLIEGMGLSSQYRLHQKKISGENEKLIIKFSRTKSLSKSIPNELLMEAFPFLLFFLSDKFIGTVLTAFWHVFGSFGAIFRCLWDYADYASSRERINTFLSLPEKNDNLLGKKLDKKEKIVAIHCQNITFSYKEQKNPLLKNYNRTFLSGQINYLTGENGVGKSTILYLLLGILIPQQGQVIVETELGKTYNLHQDLNLQSWRELNVAYCTHENLVEKGSTGQKQWTNLQNTLNIKSASQIFFFDEADNALDNERQIKFQKELQKLLNKNKLVIYIKHKNLEEK